MILESQEMLSRPWYIKRMTISPLLIYRLIMMYNSTLTTDILILLLFFIYYSSLSRCSGKKINLKASCQAHVGSHRKSYFGTTMFFLLPVIKSTTSLHRQHLCWEKMLKKPRNQLVEKKHIVTFCHKFVSNKQRY